MVPDDEKVTTRDIEPRVVLEHLVANDDVHFGVAFDKARDVSAWLTDYFDTREALQHFVPQDLELKFCQSVTKAAVNTETK